MNRGFTLIEVLVTAVLVSVALVGIMSAFRSLTAADVHAQDAELLQRLANEKLGDLTILSDPTQIGGSGDFTDRGYPDITWTADTVSTSITDLDQVTVTATRDKESQTITTMVFVRPTTTTTGSAT